MAPEDEEEVVSIGPGEGDEEADEERFVEYDSDENEVSSISLYASKFGSQNMNLAD